MERSFKQSLMALTIVSAGFLPSTAYSAPMGFKQAPAKEVIANKNFEQYPKLAEVKTAVQQALDLHETGVSLIKDKEVLEEHKKIIEEYNEALRRKAQNISCNKQQLGYFFNDADNVWSKISTWAEDSSVALLAKASDSITDASSTAQLGVLKDKLASGDVSDTGNSGLSATAAENLKKMENQTSDFDLDTINKFSKVRWDVGSAVLHDVYLNPEKWGQVKTPFTPWADQKHTYDTYLNKHYQAIENAYNIRSGHSFPARPKASVNDDYVPAKNVSGAVALNKSATYPYSADPDAFWCGSATPCQRITKGNVSAKHATWLSQFQALLNKKQGIEEPSGTDAEGNTTYTTNEYPVLTLKSGKTAPALVAPYAPDAVLPPWREVVYIINVEKQLPELGSELPNVWKRTLTSSDYFNASGEMGNLVLNMGGSLVFKPNAYDELTGEIKETSTGTKMLPLPLMTNRISSYLALNSFEEEKRPTKERAELSVKEMNDSLLATFAKAGYTPDAQFDLSKEADYDKAIAKLRELRDQKINVAKSKVADLHASFGASLLPSVNTMIGQENLAMTALQKDNDFLVRITKDDAAKIDSMKAQAIADAVAEKTYRDNVAKQMENVDAVPEVGCPVL